MSTGQEGLGEHIGGLATPEHEVFLPDAREKALKMKTSAPRRLRDMTSMPKNLRAKDLRVKKILEEKALKMKASTPCEANEPCHRSVERSQSPKVKTSRRPSHS